MRHGLWYNKMFRMCLKIGNRLQIKYLIYLDKIFNLGKDLVLIMIKSKKIIIWIS